MKKYKIGCDIDGVILALYRDQFLSIMNERHNTNKNINDLSAGLVEAYNTDQKELSEVFTLTDDYMVDLLDPECIKYLNKLIKDDHFIELVTSHVPHHLNGQEPMLERLIELKVPYHSIRFAKDKGAIANDYDFMIDDSDWHLEVMVGKTNPIRYIRPWNLGKGRPEYLDVTNWKEIYHLIDTCSRLDVDGIIGRVTPLKL